MISFDIAVDQNRPLDLAVPCTRGAYSYCKALDLAVAIKNGPRSYVKHDPRGLQSAYSYVKTLDGRTGVSLDIAAFLLQLTRFHDNSGLT